MTELIVDIATRREYTIEAAKNGENQQACPVCSTDRKKAKAKAFSYNAAKETGNCMHCGAHFVKKKELKMPEKKYVRPVWQNITELPDAVVNWFKERGISQRTLVEARVTFEKQWMPQTSKEMGVMCFNYFRDGELINVKYRSAGKHFKLVKEAELVFYGLDDIKGAEECIIVEGEIDKLSFSEMGITNVVSVPNGAAKGSLKLEYLDNCWEAFEGMKKIYIGTDDDVPGRELQEELARRLGKERCHRISYFGCKDANELLQKDRLKLTDVVQNSTEYPIEGVYTAKDIEEEIWDLWRNGLKPGCKIGVPGFDQMLSFEGGYLTVVTGIIGHGKSEWVDDMIIGLNRFHGWKAAYYSPENYPMKLHHSKLSAKMVGKHFNSHTGDDVKAGVEYSKDNFYFIFPEKDFSLDSILETAKQLVKKNGIKALVIDAWNKLEHKYTNSETQYISAELDKIDLFCKATGVHVFLVAHPTKMKKDKDNVLYEIPNLYSISGSAAFANKAANGICVYRRYFKDEKSGGLSRDSITEIHVQKVKFSHWGECGMVSLQFDKERHRFYESHKDTRNYLEMVQQELPLENENKSAVQQPNVKFESSQAVKEHNETLELNEEEYSKGGEDAPF